MSERFVCIHGHFYQPPRENPWLEAIELQDSAAPFHDWNARIAAECYAPNAAARVLDGDGRIVTITNNYSRISFNFGPTLLAWLEFATPDVYRAVVAADAASRERFGGHGSALAQAYNHVIMPLASARDKRTQVRWGIADFRRRFGRDPEGMWLPETAVDLETLDVLAEHGIAFTVLAPRQAKRVRRLRTGGEAAAGGRAAERADAGWGDISGERIDPTRAYQVNLPSGRSIAAFFYDGPISRAVAFEGILNRGEDLAARLVGAFSATRTWPQLVHIATDGETYGHHHAHGDMALAYALETLERDETVRLTNYGEFLELHPPEMEVEIFESSSWSCVHGVERWRADCGCNSGGQPAWNQSWRAPLREALDWLRDTLAARCEKRCGGLFKDLWAARDAYIDVVLDRSPESVERFLATHGRRAADPVRRPKLLKLLELQRHAMLMYTSCGWFFDEISGIETVQVIQYAARALQLAEELFGESLEEGFLERLAQAQSNLSELGDGRRIYERFVKPARVNLPGVGAHYALSSLFEEYGAHEEIYCFDVDRQALDVREVGRARLAFGCISVASRVTGESAPLSFAVLHFGDHNLTGGVREFRGEAAYRTMVDEASGAFAKADLPETLRVLDDHLGGRTYSLRSLFRDEQRRIVAKLLEPTLADAEGLFRRIFQENAPLMLFLTELGVPQPQAFKAAGELVLDVDLRSALEQEPLDLGRIGGMIAEAGARQLEFDRRGLGYVLQHRIERLITELASTDTATAPASDVKDVLVKAMDLPFAVNTWKTQNVFYDLLQRRYADVERRARDGDAAAAAWMEALRALGERLRVKVG
jgi:alpha-amylase/alpha-mannosidase (GH57 family)